MTDVLSPALASDLGRIEVSDTVVAKLASRAAAEVPDAGAPASRVLGRSLPGTREADLDALPKASASVEGTVAIVELTISVRWPASIGRVAGAVRERVRDRIGELTGLRVAEVRISVSDLVTTIKPPPRVL